LVLDRQLSTDAATTTIASVCPVPFPDWLAAPSWELQVAEPENSLLVPPPKTEAGDAVVASVRRILSRYDAGDTAS
jgi:hypothetical protein